MVNLSAIAWKKSLSVCLVLLALLAACAALLYWHNAIRVDVTNNTAEPVTEVMIVYRGGNLSWSTIQPGETASGYLFPKTETHMSISFVDSHGEAYHELDCYMEPGYRGRYSIELNREGVSFSGRTRPSLP